MIDEAGLLAFTQRLVEMDSPTEDKPLCDAVGDVLEAKGTSLGMRAARNPQDIAGDHRIFRLAGRGARRILLVGHFDTVYPAGTAGWRGLRIEGNHGIGPGALDMKGGLAIGLFAIEAALRARGRLAADLTFVMNSDEETGSATSRALIESEARAHHLALVLEPGRPGPALTIGRKGVGIFHLDVQGVEAHAGAEPEKGANAILALARHTEAVAALADPARGTTVNPGTVSGGTWPYVVPGQARLGVDIRVPTLAEQRRVEAGLAAIAAREVVPRTAATLSGGFHRPPMEPSGAAMDAAAQFQRIAQALGYPLGTAVSGGASDGNLTAAVGTPTVDGLGPHGGRAHSAEEFIELDSLFAKCRILAEFLAEG